MTQLIEPIVGCPVGEIFGGVWKQESVRIPNGLIPPSDETFLEMSMSE